MIVGVKDLYIYINIYLYTLYSIQMETVIKQAEENRTRSLSLANRIHEEYVPLKGEVDHMRREYLGLHPLPEIHEEEGSIISAEYVLYLNPSNKIFSNI